MRYWLGTRSLRDGVESFLLEVSIEIRFGRKLAGFGVFHGSFFLVGANVTMEQERR